MSDFSELFQKLLQYSETQNTKDNDTTNNTANNTANNTTNNTTNDTTNNTANDAENNTTNDTANNTVNDAITDVKFISNLQKIFDSADENEKNAEFIRALKPLLSEDLQLKADEAIKMLKIFSLIPILKDVGILN